MSVTMRWKPRLYFRYTGLLLTYCFVSYIFIITHNVYQDFPAWTERQDRIANVCSVNPILLPKPKHFNSDNPQVKQHFSKIYDKQILTNLIHIPELKLLWCLVPKVVSTSLATALTSYLQMPHPPKEPPQMELVRRTGHMGMERYREIVNISSSFLIVRHPYARIASAFRNKLEDRRRSHDGEYFYRVWSRQIIKHCRGKWTKGDHEPTFPEFIKFLLDTEIYDYDEHWAPISIRCRMCQIKYNYILKYESLNSDFSRFLSSTGLDGKLDLPWENRATGAIPLRSYFTQITKEQIMGLENKFISDMKMFGYSSDDIF